MLNYDFGDGNYLIAATYDSDSMALLDQMMESGVSPVVCHINYHICPENDENEKNISRFCQQNGLRLEVRDARFVSQEGREEQFQKWARKVRYDFFAEMYEKYAASALFLSHQQDDIVEGYLLSKKLGTPKIKYGRERISVYREMVVVRPFINYTHQDLIDYCDEHNVPYDNAISNSEESHLRSEIRRDLVDRLNEVERGQILDEMNGRSIDAQDFRAAIEKITASRDYLEIRSIIALSEGDFAATIIEFLKKHAKKRIKATEKLLKSIRSMCLNQKENDSLLIADDIYFVKEYDRISIDNDGMNLPYSYTLEAPGRFSCPTFDLDFSEGAEDRGISASDYPLTIRTVLPQDVAVFAGYLVPVKKMLLAAGISEDYLSVWPVFLDKKGKIIYVPRFNKDFVEYHSSQLSIHPQKK